MMSRAKDFLTAQGATELAEMISIYWARQGFPDVHPRVELCDNSNRFLKVFVVRSDLVGGLPRAA